MGIMGTVRFYWCVAKSILPPTLFMPATQTRQSISQKPHFLLNLAFFFAAAFE
jgi:hypothetical protein